MIAPPAELEFLSSVLPGEALLALIEAYGGTLVSVPGRAARTSSLTKLLGFEATTALVGAFGGEKVAVPLAKAWRTHVYRERGETVVAIARRLSMSRATVQRILHAGAGRRRGVVAGQEQFRFG